MITLSAFSYKNALHIKHRDDGSLPPFHKEKTRSALRWRFRVKQSAEYFFLLRYKDGGVLTLQKSITVHVDLKDAKK
jgi:hypothetical protein